jgi:hypothetical protein
LVRRFRHHGTSPIRSLAVIGYIGINILPHLTGVELPQDLVAQDAICTVPSGVAGFRNDHLMQINAAISDCDEHSQRLPLPDVLIDQWALTQLWASICGPPVWS